MVFIVFFFPPTLIFFIIIIVHLDMVGVDLLPVPLPPPLVPFHLTVAHKGIAMNIDILDSVKNWLNEFIRKSSELVVVQFQPLQTENASKFNLFFIPRSYLVRSSNVGVGISEILRKNKFSPRTCTNAKTRGNIKCHRLLSSQRFCKWSPNSSKSPSSSLRP